jgi:hypothetical protein
MDAFDRRAVPGMMCFEPHAQQAADLIFQFEHATQHQVHLLAETKMAGFTQYLLHAR